MRAILRNPRYTGRQVWNRQGRVEELLDVEDVALGHQTKRRWNDTSVWVWSADQTHEPIVSAEVFAQAQEVAAAGAHRPTLTKTRRTERRYLLGGMVRCGLCGRRMQGDWNNGVPHHRCRYAAEYALAKGVEHPKTVYVRDAAVLPALDAWLAQVFDPDNVEATCDALAMASEPDDGAAARLEAARRKVDDCDKRLAKYRAALEAGRAAHRRRVDARGAGRAPGCRARALRRPGRRTVDQGADPGSRRRSP